MTSYRFTRSIAVASGIWLLIDLLRVWTPSLITLVGEAAETPPELIGLFALGCVAVPVIPLLVLRNMTSRHSTAVRASIVIALVCRIVLQFVPGDAVQAIAASIGVIAILTWVALTAVVIGDVLVSGTAIGLAISTVTHAALGTWGAVWRLDVWGWTLLGIQAIIVLACHSRSFDRSACAARTAWLLMPALLLAGIVVSNSGRASSVAGTWGLACVSIGAVAAIGATLLPVRVPLAWTAAIVLVACVGTALFVTAEVDGVPGTSPPWSAPLYLLGAPALMYILSAADRGPASRTTSVEIGSVVWIILFFIYYAGYDLGYHADLVIMGAAVLVALIGAIGAPNTGDWRTGEWSIGPGARRFGTNAVTALVAAGVFAAAISALGPLITIRPVEAAESGDTIRVGAYNLQMGYGMDGTFKPDEVAGLLADTDVALLSEVDRGWLLNGGQDQLAILSRLLDREADFGPAADPVWGDAVLTRLPVESRNGFPLPNHGAVTDAQALAVQLRWHNESVWAVATHLQPDEENDVRAQSRDLAHGLLAPIIDDDASLFVGGDLNATPDSPAIDTLRRVGLYAAFARDMKEEPTWPADDPDRQIDHILATEDLYEGSSEVKHETLSDHLPIFVSLADHALKEY